MMIAKIRMQSLDKAMKSFAISLLAIFALFSICACASENQTSSTSKTLVAYFSQSGHTEAVAQDIAEITGGELFRIEASEPYTEDDLNYSQNGSRVNAEQKDGSIRPEIADRVDDMENYDVVFIGFPIWIREEPRIIDTFLESYDFSGKTLIPFCTSGSSDITDAEASMKEVLKDSDVKWLEGKRFPGDVSYDEVKDWVESLGLDS